MKKVKEKIFEKEYVPFSEYLEEEREKFFDEVEKREIERMLTMEDFMPKLPELDSFLGGSPEEKVPEKKEENPWKI